MKPMLPVLLVTFALVHCAQAQSLGDVARQSRTASKPHAARVITNDDLPSSKVEPPSTESTADEDSAEKKPNPGPLDDVDKVAKEKKLQSDATKKEYESRLADLRKQLNIAERELSIAKREQQIRQAEYYADASNALRDPKAWNDQVAAANQEIEKKNTEVAQLKEKLNELTEQARKAGVRLPE